MSHLENGYNEFLADLQKKLGKVDLSFALQIMHFERVFIDTKPAIDMIICYNNGTDLEKKRFMLSEHFAFLSTTYIRGETRCSEHQNALRVTGLSDLKTIFEMSKDYDIHRINGSASCASY